MPRLPTVGLFAFAIVACGDGSDATHTWQPDARVAEVRSIGSPDDLGMAGGLALGSDGKVYVADFQGGVSVFASDGSHAYDIGRPGSGPGDLTMPCCLDIGDDGQLWVADLGNRRYSIFQVSDSQAGFVRTLPSGSSGYFTTDRLQRYGAAGVYHLSTVQGGPGVGTPFVAVLDSGGAVLSADTIPPPATLPAVLEVRRETGGGVSTNRMAVPFGSMRLLAFGPGYYAQAVSGEYKVEVVPYGGGQPVIIERQLAAVPVSSREADSARAMVAEWVTAVGGKLDELQVPEMTVKPALQAIGIDHDGRIWVQRSTPDGSPSVADLYTVEGEYLETRQWPGNVQLVSWAARGETTLGVRTLPSGEISVVRLTF